MESIRLSKDFCNKWISALEPFYHAENGIIIIKQLLGKKKPVYLPLLNYCDLTEKQTRIIINNLVKNDYRSYIIPVLDFDYINFKHNDTVTLRLELSLDSNIIWENYLTAKARNQVRKAQKMGIIIKKGNDTDLLNNFYYLYQKAMYFHGSPTVSKNIINSILNFVPSRIYVAFYEHKPVSAIILTFDNKLAWVPWGASDRSYISLCPNHLVYWSAIFDTCNEGLSIFDFGRSAYGGNTYSFKKQWGAKPVKIQIITDKSINIYKKYSIAIKIWKLIPFSLANLIGPYLSKHLSDL